MFSALRGKVEKTSIREAYVIVIALIVIIGAVVSGSGNTSTTDSWLLPTVVALALARMVGGLAFRRYARSHDMPQWSPSEAYITSLRRWRRSRKAQ